jgi:outer membrane protein OmpA-like peptidoglycan-associated protein
MRQLTITRRTIVGRALTLAAGACALTTLLVACGKVPSNTPEVFVVLPSATANEPEPQLAAPDLGLLTNAAEGSNNATAYIVNPTTGSATTVRLTPLRADGQVEYGPNRTALISQNVSQVQRLVSAQAASGPFDLLAMMANAIRVTTSPGTLLIVSSGLSTAGGFDLRLVGWDADPATIAAELKHEGVLPDLTGWTVVFSGLGDTYGRQPALPLPQRTTLTQYWLAICHAADAAQCRTDDLTRPDPPSRSSRQVPVVPVPTPTQVTGPQDSTVVTVPADLLFALNRAALVPSADSVLGPLAAQARANGEQARITGYASPDGGSAAYNNALSENRALAVRNRLVALGVSADQIVSVRGLGTDGVPPQACEVNGQLDEARCAQFRRVVVILLPRA